MRIECTTEEWKELMKKEPCCDKAPHFIPEDSSGIYPQYGGSISNPDINQQK